MVDNQPHTPVFALSRRDLVSSLSDHDLLARLVEEQKTSPLARRVREVFSGLGEDSTADDYLASVKESGMDKEVLAYWRRTRNPGRTVDNIFERVAYGEVAAYTRTGEVVLPTAATINFSRRFSTDTEDIRRPHGLVVDDGVIVAVYAAILRPNQDRVDRIIPGMRVHTKRFGDLASRRVELVVVTPYHDPSDLDSSYTLPRSVEPLTLPVTKSDIRNFFREKIAPPPVRRRTHLSTTGRRRGVA